MMDDFIDLPKIQAFLAAAECLNFTEAANRLYINQSSLSKSIAAFEASVGFPLFIRGNRKVTLTREGAYLYEALLKSVNQIKQAILDTRRLRAGQIGSFTLGTAGYLPKTPMFEQICSQFSAEHPEFELELCHMSYPMLRKELMDGSVDAVLLNRRDLALAQNFCVLPIMQGKATLRCNPRHPMLSSNADPSFTDFKDCKFICLDPDAIPGYLAYLSSSCQAYGFEPKILRYTKSLSELIHYIGTTEYVSVMDSTLFPMENSDLRSISIPWRKGMAPALSTNLAWNSTNQNPALLCFVKIAERLLDKTTETIY